MERRIWFLRIIALILATFSILAGITGLFQKESLITDLFIGLCLLQVFPYAYFIYLLFLRAPSIKILDGIALFITFSTLLDLSFFQYYAYSLRPGYIIYPVLVAFAGLNVRFSRILLILSAVSLGVSIWILDANSRDMSFVLVNWEAAYITLSFGTHIFSNRLSSALHLAENQAQQLQELLEKQKKTTTIGADLSHNINGITSELEATSLQQRANSQEQAAALAQITSSMEELSETSFQISVGANAVNQSVEVTLTVTDNLKEASVAATAVSEEGAQAVAQSIQSAEIVRNRMEQLGHKLLQLTSQASDAGKIIDIIQDISQETHLLALNASIEAAGGTYGSTSSQNSRFSVIANEVKTLADRSKEAAEEVQQTIINMRGAVAGAVLVAEEAKKETAQSLLRSNVAGLVIHKLNEIILSNSSRGDDILTNVQRVKERSEEIRLATGQQHTANQQILETLRAISDVSGQSSSALTSLSNVVSSVNKKLGELTTVLNQTT